jgi:hypothetical protein
MSFYSIALFVHIVGAMLLVVLLALEGFTLRRGMAGTRLNRVLGPISLVAILVPGFYMAAQIGWRPWTAVGLAAYALIAAAGAYTGINVVRGRMSVTAATVSWLARTGIALAVVFDMTVKPDVAGSIAAVIAGVVLALAVAVPALRVVRPA